MSLKEIPTLTKLTTYTTIAIMFFIITFAFFRTVDLGVIDSYMDELTNESKNYEPSAHDIDF